MGHSTERVAMENNVTFIAPEFRGFCCAEIPCYGSADDLRRFLETLADMPDSQWVRFLRVDTQRLIAEREED